MNEQGPLATDEQPQPVPAMVECEGSPLEAVGADVRTLLLRCSELEAQLRKQAQDAKDARKAFLLELLLVMDSFDRILANVDGHQGELEKRVVRWRDSFRRTRKLLQGVLSQQGVEPMPPSAGKVEAGVHVVVSTQEHPDLEDETVIQETERGYTWHGEVLRKPSVVAVKNE